MFHILNLNFLQRNNLQLCVKTYANTWVARTGASWWLTSCLAAVWRLAAWAGFLSNGGFQQQPEGTTRLNGWPDLTWTKGVK